MLIDNTTLYLLVFARVLGIFIFNPIFSRRNMPTMVKIGICIGLAFAIATPFVNDDAINEQIDKITSVPLLAFAFLKEGVVGVVLGIITNMFISALQVPGESMDMQSGLGMAKIYDPSTGIQMPLFGTVLYYFFVFYFFITNCHLTFIRAFVVSYDFIPVGFTWFNFNVFCSVVEYFGTVLTLSIKFALPIIVSQIILEICMGILMKTVPQIQVMQVNIQMKLLFGLFILLLLSIPLAEAIEKYMGIMIDNLVGVLPLIPAT